MSELPIDFDTESVKVILAGRKTQTRWVIEPQPTLGKYGWDYKTEKFELQGWVDIDGFKEILLYDAQEYGMAHKPGDIFWVRETFLPHKDVFYYKADNKHLELEKLGIKFKWHPSIHMPREAARMFLRVTNVRVERLQDISEADAIAEGIDNPQSDGYNWGRYSSLWDSLNAKRDNSAYKWDNNPWVWVYEFERVK